MSKIPFLPLVGAVFAAVIYMMYFEIYQVTQEVAGVFIVSALAFGGIFWLIRHRPHPKPEPPPGAGKTRRT